VAIEAYEPSTREHGNFIPLGVECRVVTLPSAPKVELEIVNERMSDDGFLRIHRYRLAVRRADGQKSREFPYDVVERPALDASVMAAFHEENGRVYVWLRSTPRPPLLLRSLDPKPDEALWEVSAGLVEPGEEPRAAAVRELEEELGFTVAPEAMLPLGPWATPAPAMVGEIHWFFHCRVDPKTRREPGGDGSPLEEDAQIVPVPLDEALEACRRGLVRDEKTELAIRRLHDTLAK